MKTRAELEQLAASVPFWWHSMDLGQGVVTPGHRKLSDLDAFAQKIRLAELVGGKTVIDVGAYDGYMSFAAERAGAKRVVALDHYVWAYDIAKVIARWRETGEQGVAMTESDDLWQPEALPGKKAFDTAHRALESGVESVVAEFMEMDIASLGQFDVVLFLGVLYHMRNPLESLRRMRLLTKGVAVIQTHGVIVPGHEDRALFEFYPESELNNDPSNWWGPNLKGLEGMCRAAGFGRIEFIETGMEEEAPAPSSLLAGLRRQLQLRTRLKRAFPEFSQEASPLRHTNLIVHAYP